MSLGASQAAPLRAAAERGSGRLLLALWPMQIAALAVGLPAAVQTLALALFAAYLLLALWLAGWPNAVLSLLLAASTIMIVFIDESPGAIVRAGAEAMTFAAFLPALHLLQAVAAHHPAIRHYRHCLADAPPGSRSPQLLMGAHLLGGALTVGAVAVLSPALQAEPDQARRRRAALAVVAGISLAVLWSPLFVGMAVVSAFVPEAPLTALVLVGCVLAAAGLVIALAQLGELRSALPSLRSSSGNLGPLLPWSAGAAGAVVALRSLTTLSTLEAACLVIPLLCLALGWPPSGAAFHAAWRRTASDVAHMSGEVAIVSLAFALGMIMRASPAMADASAFLDLGSQPAAITLFGVSGAIAGASALGVHPIVAASLILGVVKPQEGILSGVALASSALLGWSCGAMLAVAGLLVMVAVGMLGVSRRQLVLGENSILVLALLAIGTLLLTALNAAIV